MKKRVLLALVAYNGLDDPMTTEAFMALTYQLGKYCSDEFDFFIEVAGKKEQFRARNQLVNHAISARMDYIWFIDDDHIITDPKGVFLKLVGFLEERKDAGGIGAYYVQRGGSYKPVMLVTFKHPKEKDKIGFQWARPSKEAKAQGIPIEVGAMGGGCMLIKTEVFSKMLEPYFWIDGQVGTDLYISTKIREAGYKIFVHLGAQVGHVRREREVIWEGTIPLNARRAGEEVELLREDLVEYYGNISPEEFDSKAQAARHDLEELWFEEVKDRKSFEQVKTAYEKYGHRQLWRSLIYNEGSDFNIHSRLAISFEDIERYGARRILDFGCGPAVTSFYMAMKRDDYEVFVMDVNDEVLEFLRWRAEKHGMRNFHTIKVSEEIPTNIPENVECVIAFDVLEHLTKPIEVVKAISENLVDRGLFYTNALMFTPHGAEEGRPQHLNIVDGPYAWKKIFPQFQLRESGFNDYLLFKDERMEKQE